MNIDCLMCGTEKVRATQIMFGRTEKDVFKKYFALLDLELRFNTLCNAYY